MIRLDDQVAIITGSGRGLGSAYARLLAERGARILEHPELPLHNNPAELAARTMVQRRNISYATQTIEGTRLGILLCLLFLLLVS
ncbi:MAG: hypothetical protein ACR9NN_14660 [Nostochopsis sp.]